MTTEFNELRERVDETADRFTSAEQNRHRQSSSLMEILGRLEQKFGAQQQQLSYYQARIEPLEQANRDLGELMQKLLGMVESCLVTDGDEVLNEAAELAARILQQDSAPDTLVPVEQAAPVASQAESVDSEDGSTALNFEDASPELLAEEARAELEGGDGEPPEDVLSAEGVAQLLATAAPKDPASESETGADGAMAVDPAVASEAVSLVNEAVAEQQFDGSDAIATGTADQLSPDGELPGDQFDPEDVSVLEAIEAIEAAGGADEVVPDFDQDMTAEMEIPELVTGQDDEAEAGSDPKSAVADALEEALEAMDVGDAVGVEEAAAGQQRDIRALLQRVEEAAKRAQDLAGNGPAVGADPAQATDPFAEQTAGDGGDTVSGEAQSATG